MLNLFQNTISKQTEFKGIGLHSGLESRIKIIPATAVHSKMYLIDGNTVAIASANFTDTGINEQHNTVTISTKPKDCENFEKIFSKIWDE